MQGLFFHFRHFYGFLFSFRRRAGFFPGTRSVDAMPAQVFLRETCVKRICHERVLKKQ